ncbi:hypothetical protein ACLESO_01000 [Pyxidicoccus sp. 3LG]
MDRGRAPTHKQAKKSFIATTETALSFLRKTFSESQVTLLLEARTLAFAVRTVLDTFSDMRVAAQGGGTVTPPVKDALLLHVPASVQDHAGVKDLLEGVQNLAGALIEFIDEPQFRATFLEWCRRTRYRRAFERLTPDVRRVEVAIITEIAKAAGLPQLTPRDLAALAVLEPNAPESPEGRSAFMKSRVDRWRYAQQTSYIATCALLPLRFMPILRWTGNGVMEKSSPIPPLPTTFHAARIPLPYQ